MNPVRVRGLVLMLGVMALAGTVAGCEGLPTSPSDPEFAITDLRAGTGAIAISGSTVAVAYTGWFYDPSKADLKGAIFDTSLGRPSFTFVLGNREVIQGWELGVAGMSVGGLRRLIVPSSLAYGDTRNGPIPPYATLVFEIELLGVTGG